MMSMPLNFKKWIDDNRAALKPPVGNKMVWKDHEFIVMVVGGPNSRKDYHVNEGEEFFHQLDGDIVLKVIENGRSRDIPIREGEIFLLPARVPHSPRRPAGSVGLVIERRRLPHEKDAFAWYCESCDAKLYEESFHLTNIETQVKEAIERFYGNAELTRCRSCGETARR